MLPYLGENNIFKGVKSGGLLASRFGVCPGAKRRAAGGLAAETLPSRGASGFVSFSRRLKGNNSSSQFFLGARIVGQGLPAPPELWGSLARAADLGLDSGSCAPCHGRAHPGSGSS